jgi:hypothetical protein
MQKFNGSTVGHRWTPLDTVEHRSSSTEQHTNTHKENKIHQYCNMSGACGFGRTAYNAELGYESLARPKMCRMIGRPLLLGRQMLSHQLGIGPEDGNPSTRAQVVDVVVADIHRGTLVSTEQSTSRTVIVRCGRAFRQAKTSATITLTPPSPPPSPPSPSTPTTTGTD